MKRFFIHLDYVNCTNKKNILINRSNFQQIETKKILDNKLDIYGQIKKKNC